MNTKARRIAIVCLIGLIAVVAFVLGINFMNKPNDSGGRNEVSGEKMSSITIRVNDHEYKVKVADNAAAQEFASSTPFELPMIELNGNEKYYQGSDKLKTEEYNPGHIEAGDLMLYGDDCIVLFYKSFDTAYSYTRLGWVENPEDLEEVLGSDNVTVIFTKN